METLLTVTLGKGKSFLKRVAANPRGFLTKSLRLMYFCSLKDDYAKLKRVVSLCSKHHVKKTIKEKNTVILVLYPSLLLSFFSLFSLFYF